MRSTVDLSDRYYSGREVQRLLGITEPRLRTLVANKELTKVYPPGYKTARYLRSEVDIFAQKWEAFLLAKEPPKATFEIAKPEDMEDEQELAERAIGPGLSVERRQFLVRANPESDYHVRHNGRLVAMLHLTPLKSEILDALMERKISWEDIHDDDIEKYEPGKPLELFITAIASDPNVSEETRMHYMVVLLRGTGREIKKLGQRGVVITKVYGRSQSPTGIAMAIHSEMVEYGKRKGKMVSFVLDIDKATSYLARMYKEGFAEWEKSQKTQPRNNRKNPVSSGQ